MELPERIGANSIAQAWALERSEIAHGRGGAFSRSRKQRECSALHDVRGLIIDITRFIGKHIAY